MAIRGAFMINPIFVLGLLLFFSQSLRAEALPVYTEEFPPYNYTEAGQPYGISTEIVVEVLRRADIDYQIESLPWARAMHYASSDKPCLIYSISRLAEREDKFRWIGKMTPVRHAAYALTQRSDININGLEDMRGFMLGTVRNGARETYLIEKGFYLGNMARTSGKDAMLRNYSMLKEGRIDLWLAPDAVAHFIVSGTGEKPAKVLREVHQLSEMSGHYYLAASPGTSDEIVAKIKAALTEFRESPEYLLILQRWGVNPGE